MFDCIVTQNLLQEGRKVDLTKPILDGNEELMMKMTVTTKTKYFIESPYPHSSHSTFKIKFDTTIGKFTWSVLIEKGQFPGQGIHE